jgi:hypothetical protein
MRQAPISWMRESTVLHGCGRMAMVAIHEEGCLAVDFAGAGLSIAVVSRPA